ncbi:MAG: hypothetical protein JO127_09455 [Caulobacteraceae bacterium]|nr:hypothetical protein [Caulobacteraceae bacterium]
MGSVAPVVAEVSDPFCEALGAALVEAPLAFFEAPMVELLAPLVLPLLLDDAVWATAMEPMTSAAVAPAMAMVLIMVGLHSPF